jgi:hypothetical protein
MLNLYPQGLTNDNSQMWVITTDNPDDEDPKWSEPRLIATDLNNFNEPIVLEDGTWLWPAGDWRFREPEHPSRPLLSTDGGQSFESGGALHVPPDKRQFDEYNVVQLRDGRLWLLNRTKANPYEAWSSDGGRTWAGLKPQETIKNPVARFYLARLHSNRLLLVKHGALDERIGRTHLIAFVSDDDGKTWQGGLVLDERRCSYPDGAQAEDGTIYVIYDHERHHACQILMARFTEKDILAGKLVSENSALKRVVNDAAGQPDKPKRWVIQKKDNADGAKLRTGNPAVVTCDAAEPHVALPGKRLFRDRDYVLKEWPEAPALEKAFFLQTPMDGKKRLRCVRQGMVYLLTPLPKRNKDSQAPRLREQGFEKVALPEFQLTLPGNPGALVTLYQKQCEASEVIQFSKWAVLRIVDDGNEEGQASK